MRLCKRVQCERSRFKKKECSTFGLLGKYFGIASFMDDGYSRKKPIDCQEKENDNSNDPNDLVFERE